MEEKLCKDCKHCDKSESDKAIDGKEYVFFYCTHPKVNPIRLVDGELIKKRNGFNYCETQRSLPMPLHWLYRACGRVGRHFEPLHPKLTLPLDQTPQDSCTGAVYNFLL